MIDQAKDVLTPNSVIAEEAVWVDDVYSIDEQDFVHGGPGGYANVPHEQLANRTAWLRAEAGRLEEELTRAEAEYTGMHNADVVDITALRAVTDRLRADLEALRVVREQGDAALAERLDGVDARLDDLERRLAEHVHSYAGSDEPGGDALTVRALASGDRVYVTGVTAARPNVLVRSPSVQVVGSTVEAGTFAGDLRGNADTAARLRRTFNLSLYGDVAGVVALDGGGDAMMSTALARQPGVRAGVYGPTQDIELDNITSFTMAQITVSAAGVITNIADRVISLPNITRSRTAGSAQAAGKLFLVGAPAQRDVAETFSQDQAFVVDGQLHSLGEPVVTVYRRQDIVNKTYNGFVLAEACERAVDATVGGTVGSSALVTSDALARHTHVFADSAEDGAARRVLTEGPEAGRVLVSADGDPRTVGRARVEVDAEGGLTASALTAVDRLEIPGGRLWIDEAVVGQSSSDVADDSLERLRARVGRLESIWAVSDGSAVVTDLMAELQRRVCALESLFADVGADPARVQALLLEPLVSRTVLVAASLATVDDGVNVLAGAEPAATVDGLDAALAAVEQRLGALLGGVVAVDTTGVDPVYGLRLRLAECERAAARVLGGD